MQIDELDNVVVTPVPVGLVMGLFEQVYHAQQDCTINRLRWPRDRQLMRLSEITQSTEALQPTLSRRKTLTTKYRDSFLFQASPPSCDDTRIERIDFTQHSLREMMLEVGIEKSESGKDSGRRRDNNFFQ